MSEKDAPRFYTKYCAQCHQSVLPRLSQKQCGHDLCPFAGMPLREHPEPVECPRCHDMSFCGIFAQIWEGEKQIAPERLLCKWCGYCYAHVYGLIQAEPRGDKGYWDKRGPRARWRTPSEMASGPFARCKIEDAEV